MKKLLSILLTLALTLSLSAPALAIHEGEIGICLDGRTYYPTSLPVQVQNGRTMVPLRDLAEKLGADVEWVQEKQEIVMTRAGSTVTMTLGKTTADVDGAAMEMDVAPYAVEGHTLIPARYVAEFFGQLVTWDQEKQLVVVEEDKSVAGDSNLEDWALAMGAMLVRINYGRIEGFGGDGRAVPMSYSTTNGMSPTMTMAEFAREMLSDDWGITGRADLIETVTVMTTGGHNVDFQETAAVADSLTDAEWKDLIAQSGEVDAYMWSYTKALAEKWGDKGILAWDLFRMSNLAQWGYVAGYVTYAESLALVEPAARLLCETFSSWEEAYENYLDGYIWWSRTDLNGQDVWETHRGRLYRSLRGGESAALFDDSLFTTGVIGLPEGVAPSLEELAGIS